MRQGLQISYVMFVNFCKNANPRSRTYLDFTLAIEMGSFLLVSNYGPKILCWWNPFPLQSNEFREVFFFGWWCHLGVFWMNIAKNWIYLWYVYCLNLFGKWEEKRISVMVLPKFWEKYEREERNNVTDGERKRNFGNNIATKKKLLWQLNCRNWRIKKRKKLNCCKSNAMPTNYFTIFLQTVIMTNFLLLIKVHQ